MNQPASRVRGKPTESRLRYHVRWIGINIAILAVSAYVYAGILIPRYIVGETAATRTAAGEWIAGSHADDAAAGGEQHREEVGRPEQPMPMPVATVARKDPAGMRHPYRQRVDRGSATPAFVDTATLRALGATCISGMPVRREIIDGVPSYSPIPGLTCHQRLK